MTTLPSGRYHLVTLFSCFSTSDADTIDPHCLPLLTDISLFHDLSHSEVFLFIYLCVLFYYTHTTHSLSHRLPCSLTRETRVSIKTSLLE